AQITALSSRVMQDVRKMVLNLMSDNAKGATGRNLVWLERLQLVDEASIGKFHPKLGFVLAHHVRYEC
ncbi:unnamed protein product, partial [Symbiodinium sp. KB8]